MKAPQTLIGIQEEYMDRLNAGIERWSHRKDGGHTARIARGARHAAEKQLRRIGFTDQRQIDALIKDAQDMAALVRTSEEAA